MVTEAVNGYDFTIGKIYDNETDPQTVNSLVRQAADWWNTYLKWNGVINMSYPLVSYEVVYGLNFKTIVASKFALDVPKIGTNSEQYAFSYSPGLEGSVYYTGALDVLTFYSNFRFGVTGGNNLFYQNLNKTDQSAFAFNQISFGVAITSMFRVSYNKYFGSTFVKDNFPESFSFVFIPN